MVVYGYCRKCKNHFDAHWHNYPEGVSMTDRFCLSCKSHDVYITNDEAFESPTGDDYSTEEDD